MRVTKKDMSAMKMVLFIAEAESKVLFGAGHNTASREKARKLSYELQRGVDLLRDQIKEMNARGSEISLEDEVDKLTVARLRDALIACDGAHVDAARLLAIASPQSFEYKLDKYELKGFSKSLRKARKNRHG